MIQVILTKPVAKLGRRGELKNVKDGYYRNFLMPRGLAVLPTPGRMKEVEARKVKMALEKEQIKANLQDVLKKLEKSKITFSRKTTSTGKLYAGITQKHIAEAVNEQLKLHLSEESIEMKEHLKSAGNFTVTLRLAEDVTAPLAVEITAAK